LLEKNFFINSRIQHQIVERHQIFSMRLINIFLQIQDDTKQVVCGEVWLCISM